MITSRGQRIDKIQIPVFVPERDERAMVQALDRSLGSTHNLTDFRVGEMFDKFQDDELLALWR